MSVDRTPPVSLSAEVAVLGAMLIDPEAVVCALDKLTENDFYREANRRLFRAMAKIFGRGGVVDVITLNEELKNTGEQEAAGGSVYLAELLDAVPTAAHVEHHAEAVKDKALLRRVIDASSGAIRDCYDTGGVSAEEVLAIAENRLLSISGAGVGDGYVESRTLIMPLFEVIEKRADSDEPMGEPSGFKMLDTMLGGGFQNGDLIIIAGRPAMGKTSLALSVALTAAVGRGRRVGVASLEMSKEMLMERMLSTESRVDSQNLRSGKLDTEEYKRLATGAGLLDQISLSIDDSPIQTSTQIRARARRLSSGGPGLDLLIVDYLQLLTAEDPTQGRVQQLSNMTRNLKILARELDCPVIVLSQLSRAVEGRSDKRPMLSDLRESGSIEQDADVVIFLYRPEYYLTPDEARRENLEGACEIIVSKQRNGPTGSVWLSFRKTYTRFDDVAPRHMGGAV